MGSCNLFNNSRSCTRYNKIIEWIETARVEEQEKELLIKLNRQLNESNRIMAKHRGKKLLIVSSLIFNYVLARREINLLDDCRTAVLDLKVVR